MWCAARLITRSYVYHSEKPPWTTNDVHGLSALFRKNELSAAPNGASSRVCAARASSASSGHDLALVLRRTGSPGLLFVRPSRQFLNSASEEEGEIDHLRGTTYEHHHLFAGDRIGTEPICSIYQSHAALRNDLATVTLRSSRSGERWSRPRFVASSTRGSARTARRGNAHKGLHAHSSARCNLDACLEWTRAGAPVALLCAPAHDFGLRLVEAGSRAQQSRNLNSSPRRSAHLCAPGLLQPDPTFGICSWSIRSSVRVSV